MKNLKHTLILATVVLTQSLSSCSSNREDRIKEIMQENENLNADLENKKRKTQYEQAGVDYDTTLEIKAKIVE